MAFVSFTGWLKNKMSNRSGTRRNQPRSPALPIRRARLSVEALEDRTVPASIVTPAGLNPGDAFTVVYTTSGHFNALSQDINTYNAQVTTQAAGLTYNGASQNWEVLGATPTVNNHAALLTSTAPVYSPTGTFLGANGSAFLSSTTAVVNIDENLNTQAPAFVWIGGWGPDAINALGLGDRGAQRLVGVGMIGSPMASGGISANADNAFRLHSLYGYAHLVVVAANAPPTIAVDVAAVSANEGGTLTNTGTFSDAQGNGTVTVTASVGMVTKNDATGTWSWSLGAADNLGSTTVIITANDGTAAPVATSFDYSVNNLNPDAVDNLFGAPEGGIAQALDLLGNDSDPAGANDPLSITSVNTTGTVGQATLASGVVSYSPNGQFESLGVGQTATDTFSYSISDGDGGSDTATVTVMIQGQNDAPTATGTLSNVSVNQNAANSVISLAGLFQDVDTGDTLTITAVSSSSGLVTAGVSGSNLTLDYQPNQFGTSVITVTATDGSGATVNRTFNVAVLSAAQQGAAGILLIQQWQTSGMIDGGVANAMIGTLADAVEKYEKGNINAAGNKLNALKNQISAKVKPGGLTAAQAALAFSMIDALYASMTP